MTTPLQNNISNFYIRASAQKEKHFQRQQHKLIGMDANIPYMATLTFLTQTTSLREKINITI